ncbi:LOW QUALITY PROTEIN: hypothetical protein OSB04_006344 [Centaurea solstitialis]|uniref:CCHC-type domain-containing protein n=1 Tax=Centaurea solstitialis TaxID=347529 RepID=A0AA38WRY9_9ASTR|nr:LOW QUALITY PROTEIN: hypothetical protein OSB04_006344 [Centaurea solstitialis]
MNNMEKTIAELHSMLKTAELNMGAKNKTKDELMVRDGGLKKKHGHGGTGKGKGPSAPKVRENIKGKGKGKKVKPNKARTENRCFTCNEVGHWRQNCPKRHEAVISRLNNSYKRCRPKTARIFDRVANIGRDPWLRLLLGFCHKISQWLSPSPEFLPKIPPLSLSIRRRPKSKTSSVFRSAQRNVRVVDHRWIITQAFQVTFQDQQVETGPYVPTQTVLSVPATNTEPAIPPREMEKPVPNWTDEDKRLVSIDTKARSLISMSLPDDAFHSICHLRTAKEI